MSVVCDRKEVKLGESLPQKCVYLSVGIHHYDLNMTQGISGTFGMQRMALQLGVATIAYYSEGMTHDVVVA